MYQMKQTPPPIRDFMIEKSLKLTKIFNLNLLKFDCQNLPFRRSPQGGHSTVKNTGGWLDSLGSGILVGKDILGFFKIIDLDNSRRE